MGATGRILEMFDGILGTVTDWPINVSVEGSNSSCELMGPSLAGLLSGPSPVLFQWKGFPDWTR